MIDTNLVSILVRTKDRPVEVAQAITSVLEQNYRPLQLIVVNDGGIELDEDLVFSIKKSDVDFVYQSLVPSGGRSRAANVALEAATGQWLMFLDDDDLILPNHVATLLKVALKNPKAVGAYADIQCVSLKKGKLIPVDGYYGEDFDPLRLVLENFIPIHAVLFHRRVVDAGCRFDTTLSLYEDWHFWLQVIRFGHLVHHACLGGYYRIDCSGVGRPGTNMDFNDELVAFLEAARNVWSHEQLKHLIRGAANLRSCQEVVARLTDERDEVIRVVARLTDERDEVIRAAARLESQCNQFQEQADSLKKSLDSANESLDSANESLDSANAKSIQDVRLIEELQHQIAAIMHSRSWRYTQFLRNSKIFCLAFTLQGISFFRKLRNVSQYLVKGDFAGLKKRIRGSRDRRTFLASSDAFQGHSDALSWGVMVTAHTQFIGHLIVEQLVLYGYFANLYFDPPENFSHDYYIVVCPQMFDSLPPEEKRICYQMEQSVSSRWFEKKYLSILDKSLAVIDYSLINIDFLNKKNISYPKVYYIPVGSTRSFTCNNNSDKIYDILFYGDCKSSKRRQIFLSELEKHYNVRILSEVFGEEIKKEITRSRLVINLHYYENSLLEMPRIQECLSLGVPVLSESSQDQDDYPELGDAVRFFEQGSVTAMLAAAEGMLESPPSPKAIEEAVSRGCKRWTFFFGRMLIGLGFLPATAVEDLPAPVDLFRGPVVLSLPETISRRHTFEANNQLSCQTFDGIRYQPGWIGCGLSYSFLARQALKCGCTSLTVMEDDVLMPEDMQERLNVVYDYLQREECDWDLFVGVIADLHKGTKVIKVEKYRGLTFVTIDRMTSMVFNIYTKKVLEILTLWNSDYRDDKTNTIDRFIERKTDLKVVVLLPFLVGHREDLYSTLWGFKNDTYLEMIYESEKILRELVEKYSEDCLKIE